MIEYYEDFDMYRYEVGIIINDNFDILFVTNDLEAANNYYEATINKYSPDNDTNHTIVFLYDYDKNANINYYDSEDNIC